MGRVIDSGTTGLVGVFRRVRMEGRTTSSVSEVVPFPPRGRSVRGGSFSISVYRFYVSGEVLEQSKGDPLPSFLTDSSLISFFTRAAEIGALPFLGLTPLVEEAFPPLPLRLRVRTFCHCSAMARFVGFSPKSLARRGHISNRSETLVREEAYATHR